VYKTLSPERKTIDLYIPNELTAKDNAIIQIGDNNGNLIIEEVRVHKKRFSFSFRIIVYFLVLFVTSFLLYALYKLVNYTENNDYTSIFWGSIICAAILFWMEAIFTRGYLIQSVFHPSTDSVFSDFFWSVSNGRYRNPYEVHSNYPAMALLIFKFLFHVVPISEQGDSFYDLRNNEMIWMIFIVYTVLSLVLLVHLYCNKLEVEGVRRIIVSVGICLSLPVLYLLERGNIALLALLLTSFFCFNYESENKTVREIAYFSLAFAASIKIYPAVYGLLLLKKKKIKDAFRLTIYGMVMFFSPFALFGGVNGVKNMILGLSEFSDIVQNNGYGSNLSLSNSLHLLLRNQSVLGSINVIIAIISILFLITMTIAFIWANDSYIEMLILTLILVELPSFSMYYVSSFLLIPFAFLCKKKKYSVHFVLYFGLFATLCMPYISDYAVGYRYVLSYSSIMQIGATCLLTLLAISKALTEKGIKIKSASEKSIL
jgi:hypothetical protein